ncbi:hypothetical protein TrST_g3842 [Triparma strigata]|nr:hypothetical protein TrST_g3842 [Triparma strigata]
MEIFLASVVGLIASVLLATHYSVDNVLFHLPPMFAFYLILNLAIVRCIVNQAKEQSLPTSKEYNPDFCQGKPRTHILKMTFFTICLLACMAIYEFITIMRLLINAANPGHHRVGVILTLSFVPFGVGLSGWFGAKFLRRREISYLLGRHNGRYDGNDPQGMIEAEEGGMECNSFDGGDMLDDSFDEIETKQRRLSNPDYELEIEMGRTGERDDKERP